MVKALFDAPKFKVDVNTMAHQPADTFVLNDIGRVKYLSATDDEAVNAFAFLSRTEGIIPAIESAHAVAYAMKLAPTLDKDQIIVINLSGRGDKDVYQVARYMGVDIHE